jgi:hypothetical protein
MKGAVLEHSLPESCVLHAALAIQRGARIGEVPSHTMQVESTVQNAHYLRVPNDPGVGKRSHKTWCHEVVAVRVGSGGFVLSLSGLCLSMSA